jgi:hypothetical protein
MSEYQMTHALKAGVRAVAVAAVLLASSAVAIAAPQPPAKAAPDAKADGATGISGFAVVDASGALVRRLNAKSAARLGAGFEVLFNSKVSNCVYVGNVGLPGAQGSNPNGWLTVASRNGNAKGVYVETHNATGALAYLPFHLLVSC